MDSKLLAIRKRDDLPSRERVVSDTLDEYLIRMHGIYTSWAHPVEFIEWLEDRGYTVVVATSEEG